MGKIMIRTSGLSIALLFAYAMPAFANYFVGGTGNDGHSGLDSANAFRNLSKAAGLVNPGDTVWVLNGTYLAFNITRPGNALSWIVWKGKSGNSPEVKISRGSWTGISIKTTYQIIDGFTITGLNDSVTYDSAMADFNRSSPSGTYNSTGISMDGRTLSPIPHHIIIRNCIVRKCSESGIYAIAADYTTFEDNIVYDNAWYSRYGGSGIGRGYSTTLDQNAGYHNIIQRNVIWNNRDSIPWSSGNRSDGNGIIIDSDNDNGYIGGTLICNNICFNNGGSGIHTYKASNVDIVNNTTYYNGRVENWANCFANVSKNVNILNNIMYASPGEPGNLNNRDTNVVYNYNIYYGGLTPVVMGAYDRAVNPGLVNPSIDPAVADFRLLSTSPAINSGTTFAAINADFAGSARPQGNGYDIGAYEYLAGVFIRRRSMPCIPRTLPRNSTILDLKGERQIMGHSGKPGIYFLRQDGRLIKKVILK